MAYPKGPVPTTTPVHPTPVYETLAMLLVAWWLWRHRHSWQPGTLFALYLVLAGLERFLVEFIRRNDDVVAGVTQPQLISLAMMIAGGGWLGVRGAPAPASGGGADAAAADPGGDDDRGGGGAGARASPRRSQRRASPCSSASCCTERWWPPGTMTSLD